MPFGMVSVVGRGGRIRWDGDRQREGAAFGVNIRGIVACNGLLSALIRIFRGGGNFKDSEGQFVRS